MTVIRFIGKEPIDPTFLNPIDPLRIAIEQRQRIDELTAQRDRLRDEIEHGWRGIDEDRPNRRAWIESNSPHLEPGDMTGA